MLTPAFQDQIPGNHCFGCGPTNQGGLRIKSFWSGPGTSECTFQPAPEHNAGPPDLLNGGIIATLIDCHCVCTAIAGAYLREGRAIGAGELIWYVTGTITVRYLKPAPLAEPVRLVATILEEGLRKTRVACVVRSSQTIVAEAEVIAIRVAIPQSPP